MTGSSERMRKRLLERQSARGKGAQQPQEISLTVKHMHCPDFCYLQIAPPPPNGLLRMTIDQYEATIAEMQKVAKSFKEANRAK